MSEETVISCGRCDKHLEEDERLVECGQCAGGTGSVVYCVECSGLVHQGGVLGQHKLAVNASKKEKEKQLKQFEAFTRQNRQAEQRLKELDNAAADIREISRICERKIRKEIVEMQQKLKVRGSYLVSCLNEQSELKLAVIEKAKEELSLQLEEALELERSEGSRDMKLDEMPFEYKMIDMGCCDDLPPREMTCSIDLQSLSELIDSLTVQFNNAESELKDIKFSAQTIEDGEKRNVMVTGPVSKQGHFPVLTEFSEDMAINLDRLSDCIRRKYLCSRSWETFGVDGKMPEIGQRVYVQYPYDNKWYRADIEEITASRNGCFVKFTDFGNTEGPIALSRVLPSDKEVEKNLESQVIHCALYEEDDDVSLSFEARFLFKDMTASGQVPCQFMKQIKSQNDKPLWLVELSVQDQQGTEYNVNNCVKEKAAVSGGPKPAIACRDIRYAEQDKVAGGDVTGAAVTGEAEMEALVSDSPDKGGPVGDGHVTGTPGTDGPMTVASVAGGPVTDEEGKPDVSVAVASHTGPCHTVCTDAEEDDLSRGETSPESAVEPNNAGENTLPDKHCDDLTTKQSAGNPTLRDANNYATSSTTCSPDITENEGVTQGEDYTDTSTKSQSPSPESPQNAELAENLQRPHESKSTLDQSIRPAASLCAKSDAGISDIHSTSMVDTARKETSLDSMPAAKSNTVLIKSHVSQPASDNCLGNKQSGVTSVPSRTDFEAMSSTVAKAFALCKQLNMPPEFPPSVPSGGSPEKKHDHQDELFLDEKTGALIEPSRINSFVNLSFQEIPAGGVAPSSNTYSSFQKFATGGVAPSSNVYSSFQKLPAGGVTPSSKMTPSVTPPDAYHAQNEFVPQGAVKSPPPTDISAACMDGIQSSPNWIPTQHTGPDVTSVIPLIGSNVNRFSSPPPLNIGPVYSSPTTAAVFTSVPVSIYQSYDSTNALVRPQTSPSPTVNRPPAPVNTPTPPNHSPEAVNQDIINYAPPTPDSSDWTENISFPAAETSSRENASELTSTKQTPLYPTNSEHTEAKSSISTQKHVKTESRSENSNSMNNSLSLSGFDQAGSSALQHGPLSSSERPGKNYAAALSRPLLHEGMSYECRVTSDLNVDGSVWTQIARSSEADMAFNHFTQELESVGRCAPSVEAKLGSLVLAQDESSCWRRAVLVENRGQKAMVRFVDIGRTQVVALSSLRGLPSKFSNAQIPFKAILVSIKTKKATDFPPPMPEIFRRLTKDKILKAWIMCVTNKNQYYCRLDVPTSPPADIITLMTSLAQKHPVYQPVAMAPRPPAEAIPTHHPYPKIPSFVDTSVPPPRVMMRPNLPDAPIRLLQRAIAPVRHFSENIRPKHLGGAGRGDGPARAIVGQERKDAPPAALHSVTDDVHKNHCVQNSSDNASLMLPAENANKGNTDSPFHTPVDTPPRYSTPPVTATFTIPSAEEWD